MISLSVPNAISREHAEALIARRRARPGEKNRANQSVRDAAHAKLAAECGREWPAPKKGEGE